MAKKAKMSKKLGILTESKDVLRRRSFAYMNLTKDELQENVSNMIYKKHFEEKRKDILIKGIQRLTFFP